MKGSIEASRKGALNESSSSESASLKNRMAVYQAAASNQETTGFSSAVMEEADVCTLPGGLASIRRQFESESRSASRTVTRTTLQELSESSAVSVSISNSSSSGGRQVSQQLFLQDERAAHLTQSREGISSLENHHNQTEEDEYYPKLSTKELAQHFEKTIEEAAPSKKIKTRVPKSEMCAVCKKRVYPMEGLIADKKKFHKSCFFCEHCKNKLSLGNFVSLHGRLYCQPHYAQLFKSKGNFENGFGQGLSLVEKEQDRSDWRFSLSQSSMCSLSEILDKEANQSPSKISVVWPPQAAAPKKSFSVDLDVKLEKPVWPPKTEKAKSPKSQRRKVSQRTTL